jgi:hypothetical protein
LASIDQRKTALNGRQDIIDIDDPPSWTAGRGSNPFYRAQEVDTKRLVGCWPGTESCRWIRCEISLELRAGRHLKVAGGDFEGVDTKAVDTLETQPDSDWVSHIVRAAPSPYPRNGESRGQAPV